MVTAQRKSAEDEARFYKRSHKQRLASLEIAKKCLEHIVMEVITFSNQETTVLLRGLREQIESGIAEQEKEIDKYRAIIRAEMNRPLNDVERMVEEHRI